MLILSKSENYGQPFCILRYSCLVQRLLHIQHIKRDQRNYAKDGLNLTWVLNLLNSSTCRYQLGLISITLLAIKVKYEMETTAYREGTGTMKNCCGKYDEIEGMFINEI
jgi:hypothetical protein